MLCEWPDCIARCSQVVDLRASDRTLTIHPESVDCECRIRLELYNTAGTYYAFYVTSFIPWCALAPLESCK